MRDSPLDWYRLLLPMHCFGEDFKFGFDFFILRFQVWVLLLTKDQVLFQCLQRKTNIHIIKYTNILQPTDSRTSVCPCTAVIKSNKAPVTWQSFNIVSILCISAKASVCYHVPAADLPRIITFSDSRVRLTASFVPILTSFATLSRSSSAILSSRLCWRTQAWCFSCCSSCSTDLI